ncbi:Diphthamide biosynthesis protein 3 [Zancudomyces culisetae]|uniref:Diphthamide biosynthesis protein 3 n=1 Tax=Zancudomyces culisetae TaxID=1213189 RepID=A0A1R1PDX8_ZANCU|nr:Diphthamide biosynthesis protein 3 [Zancudomyces culisetae]|eukprot:OMH79118.1 Diphthamide biosynthesis protein 3 [Zancudomyces culisetae]
MSVYDEVEIEDMEFDEDLQMFYYPCPCGDRFQISLEEINSGEDIASCPSCSLLLKVIYDPEDFCDSDNDDDAVSVDGELVACM